METYNVTFVHPYWHITTTVEHPGAATMTDIREEVIELAEDWIYRTSGLELSGHKFVDIDVEYVGEVV